MMSDFYAINALRKETAIIAVFVANIVESHQVEKTRIEDNAKIKMISSHTVKNKFLEEEALEIARKFVRHSIVNEAQFCTYSGYMGVVPCKYSTCITIDGITVTGVQFEGGGKQFLTQFLTNEESHDDQ